MNWNWTKPVPVERWYIIYTYDKVLLFSSVWAHPFCYILEHMQPQMNRNKHNHHQTCTGMFLVGKPPRKGQDSQFDGTLWNFPFSSLDSLRRKRNDASGAKVITMVRFWKICFYLTTLCLTLFQKYKLIPLELLPGSMARRIGHRASAAEAIVFFRLNYHFSQALC